MKKIFLVILLFCTTSIVTFTLLTRAPSAPASQAFINANLLTMDDNSSIAQAVYIENDRIKKVGSNEDIKQLISSQTQVHDLEGKTLLPGFIEAHGHFPGSGLKAVSSDLNSPPIGDISSIKQLLIRLKEQADNTKKGEWLVGFGYDDTLVTEHRHPTRQELDSVSTEHPIFILHVSGHLGVANSLAMNMINIFEDTPNPSGGVIEKDSQGQLTGLVAETATLPFIASAMKFTIFQGIKIINAAVDEYASMGVTSVQNGAADEKGFNTLRYASKFNLVPMRIQVWPHYKTLGPKFLSGELDPKKVNTNKFEVSTYKIVADGSIQGYTGFLSEPYHVLPNNAQGQPKENYVGYPTLNRVKLTELVTKVYQKGLHLAVHGNGDAAIDNIIYAVEQAQKKYPKTDPRTILIHAQMARNDQLDKMKELGITPSFFTAHTYYWGDRHASTFMGAERASRMSPAQSANQKGLRFSIHLDTPVVPINPMLMVWNAVNRVSTSGQVIGAHQRISVMQALRATTIDAAWQTFKDKDLGSIEAGKLADLVILEQNPLTIESSKLKDIKVLATYVGGVSIYKREN